MCLKNAAGPQGPTDFANCSVGTMNFKERHGLCVSQFFFFRWKVFVSCLRMQIHPWLQGLTKRIAADRVRLGMRRATIAGRPGSPGSASMGF